MDNQIDQIDDGGRFQGGLLCDGCGYRERQNIVFISSCLQYCGMVQKKGILLRVEFLKKIVDPQWSLPLWDDDESSSLTNSLEDAKILIAGYFERKTGSATALE